MILIGFLIVFNSFAPKLSRNGFTIQTFWQKNHSELAQHVGTPLTELRGTDGIDPITHGDNGIVMLSSFPFSFPIPLQSGQALHDALRFEAHLDHGEQQVEDVARRVNEKKSDRPSQGSRLNKTLNYDLNQALAINISHNAI